MATSTIPGTVGIGGVIGSSPLGFSSFNPPDGEVRSRVQILGSGLLSVTGVDFNGVAADPSTASGSDAELNITVPDRATTGPITITDGTTSITSTMSFTVDPGVPEDLKVNPQAAKAGATVKITGRHLLLASVVFKAANGSFPGVPLAQMPKSFKVVVPQAAAPGKARIVITNPAGRGEIQFMIKR